MPQDGLLGESRFHKHRRNNERVPFKQQFDLSAACDAAGPVLFRVFHKSFSVAKRVRTETGISRGAANVSSVAVELAKRGR